ncbi:MarR family transcriptional regulator [Candidatus Woesearchaeota archaeon]|nr:MarR family transcriptional regulator [Candidatus Woesearchaeota archaeon]
MSDLEKDFIEYCVRIGRGMGFDSLSGKLIGIVYIEPEKVAMEELAQRTGYSLASVSARLKKLESHGLVERSKQPGSKKLYYFMEKDLHKVMQKMFKRVYDTEVVAAKNEMPRLIDRYKKMKLTQNEQKKLHNIKYYHRQVLEFEKHMLSFAKCLEGK